MNKMKHKKNNKSIDFLLSRHRPILAPKRTIFEPAAFPMLAIAKTVLYQTYDEATALFWPT
jgi:hypothetical protein